MGLISKYKQDLVGKVFLYTSNGNKFPYMYCIGRITSVDCVGVGYNVICTNIFSYKNQWFSAGCLMDMNSKIIRNVNMNYLKLFQEFYTDIMKM